MCTAVADTGVSTLWNVQHFCDNGDTLPLEESVGRRVSAQCGVMIVQRSSPPIVW